jgi:hypothetical protein
VHSALKTAVPSVLDERCLLPIILSVLIFRFAALDRIVLSVRARSSGLLAAPLLAPDSIAVYRCTKLLPTSDWLGREYVVNVSTDEEMLTLLTDAEITHVIVDEGVPESAVWPHQLAISKAIKNQRVHFPLVTEVPARRRDLQSQLTIAKFSH